MPLWSDWRCNQRNRQRPPRTLSHGPQHGELVVTVEMITHDLEHTSTGRTNSFSNTDQLVGLGVERGSKLALACPMVCGTRGTETHTACLDSVANQVRHSGNVLGSCWLTVGAALTHDMKPESPMGDIGPAVDVVRNSFDRVEIFGEAVPVPGQAFVQRCPGDIFDAFHQFDELVVVFVVYGRETHTAVTHDHRRHAMP